MTAALSESSNERRHYSIEFCWSSKIVRGLLADIRAFKKKIHRRNAGIPRHDPRFEAMGNKSGWICTDMQPSGPPFSFDWTDPQITKGRRPGRLARCGLAPSKTETRCARGGPPLIRLRFVAESSLREIPAQLLRSGRSIFQGTALNCSLAQLLQLPPQGRRQLRQTPEAPLSPGLVPSRQTFDLRGTAYPKFPIRDLRW